MNRLIIQSSISQKVPVNFLRMSKVLLFQSKEKNKSQGQWKNHFLSPSKKSPYILLANPAEAFLQGKPLHTVLFSGCQENKRSDGIWKDLAEIQKSNFLLPFPPPTAAAGENYGSKKNKAPAMLKLAALSNKNFYIFP